MKLLAAIQLLLPGMPFIYYGDEVGMTGGQDPDCRRGMLWEDARQDKDMLSYYKRLIAVRKSNPCLTEGDAEQMTADDDSGLVTIRRGDLVVLFHGQEGDILLPRYAGKSELISGGLFDGTLGAYEAAVLKV